MVEDFCIWTSYHGPTPELVVADATTGCVVSTVLNPRECTIDEQSLYQLANSTFTFEELVSNSQVLWHSTVSALFGAGHSPH